MKVNKISIIVIISFLTIANAQSETMVNNLNKRQVTAIRLQSPLTIDGVLDEELYNTKLYSDFVQYVPDNGEPATEKTDIGLDMMNQQFM